ncbi:hypothetical protein [Brevundimonas sp.]|uniref:hypothetical protein n=1 Tax=Brevundimonas sp. TaxID=1871086 RepID=UPI0028A1FFD5|nr:hypothetical protein [Brevundimonas sp.]
MPLMWVTDQFRYGLDADMVHLWAEMSVLSLLYGVLGIGLVVLPVLILAYWVVRLGKLRRRWFVILVAAILSLPVLAINLYFMIDELVQPTVGVVPFEASSLTYLPNYLEPASVAVAMALAASIYLAFAKERP